jgi:Flp pilus assembly protein TadD
MQKKVPMHKRHRPVRRTARIAGAAIAASALLGACTTDVAQTMVTTPPASEAVHYESLMRVADAMRASGDNVAAIGMYKRAGTMMPLNPEPLVKLGAALADLKAYNEAATAYRSALGLDATNVEAMRGLGNVLLSLDQPQVALKHLEAALAIDASDSRIHNSLGVVLDLIGDHRGAQARYRQGLTASADNLVLRNNLGLSLALSGDYREAIGILRSIAMHPAATVRNRQNLALVYGLAGDLEAAARVARMDLDENAVRSNLAYYTVLREMADRPRVSTLGANPVRAEIMGIGKAEPQQR